jgi:hypothetical protein
MTHDRNDFDRNEFDRNEFDRGGRRGRTRVRL